MILGAHPLQMLLIVLMLIPLLVLHEIAHGLTALVLGDTTARDSGRLSLNPLRHIDWLGLLMIVVVGIGWAKPVMIEPDNLKNKKRDMAFIALAGPFTNLVVAFFLLFLGIVVFDAEVEFIFPMARLSVILAVFNMLPIPPLDGSKVLAAFIPDRFYQVYSRYEGWGVVIFLILIVTGVAIGVIVPIVDSIYHSFVQFWLGYINPRPWRLW